MRRKTQNLKLVEKRDEETRRREEEENWKLTPDEVAGRVREIRQCLEEFASRLAGVHFDIAGSISHPPSIDYDELPHPDQLAERLKGHYERLYAKLDGLDSDDLDNIMWQLADTAFAIALLAGPIFNGTASREIDRLERGLVHATVSRRWQVN